MLRSSDWLVSRSRLTGNIFSLGDIGRMWHKSENSLLVSYLIIVSIFSDDVVALSSVAVGTQEGLHFR